MTKNLANHKALPPRHMLGCVLDLRQCSGCKEICRLAKTGHRMNWLCVVKQRRPPKMIIYCEPVACWLVVGRKPSSGQ